MVSAERARDFPQSDIDHPTIYGAFADLPIYGLEDLGTVPRGEAGAFIVERNTAAGGKLPLETNGDGLSYMHSGMHAAGERASDPRHHPAQTPTSQSAAGSA